MKLTKENCSIELNVILEGDYAGVELLEANVKGYDDPLFLVVPGSNRDNELSNEQKITWLTANPEWREKASIKQKEGGKPYVSISNRKTAKVLDL